MQSIRPSMGSSYGKAIRSCFCIWGRAMASTGHTPRPAAAYGVYQPPYARHDIIRPKYYLNKQ